MSTPSVLGTSQIEWFEEIESFSSGSDRNHGLKLLITGPPISPPIPFLFSHYEKPMGFRRLSLQKVN